MKFATLPGLAVLNAAGRDPDQSFAHGAGNPDAKRHAPVNFHAYAACTQGAFYRTPTLAARHRSVLLLLRGDLKGASKAFGLLKSHGCFVGLAFKEAGTHQVAGTLRHPKTHERFCRLAGDADLCVSSTPELVALFRAVSRRVVLIPTPYPIEQPSWDFAQPVEARRGLFIGTREFDVPTRNHLLVLSAARTLAAPLTVVARPEDGSTLAALALAPDLLQAVRPLPYPDYLRLMATHRLVLQFDASAVPGQVAGDALLCGLPTVGGNGATERLILPELNGYGRDFRTLLDLAQRLLHDDAEYLGVVEQMRRRAHETVSFSAVRAQLASCFPGCEGYG